MKIIDLLIQKSKGIDFEVIDNNFYFKNIYTLLEHLNDEVEIIEDNKIEKIKDYSIMTTMGLDSKLQERKISKVIELKEVVDKINEIIDRLNGE